MFVTVKNRTKLTGICIRVGQSAATISYQFSNASPRDSSFFFLHKLEPQVGDYELRIRISDLNTVFSRLNTWAFLEDTRPRGPGVKKGYFSAFLKFIFLVFNDYFRFNKMSPISSVVDKLQNKARKLGA